jgi:prepilin-type N-terminal cleavage/methylation domain-containing protein
MSPQASPRGFTLIELITALAVFTIAIAAATMMMTQGATMSRDAESTLISQDNATVAGAMITDAIAKAGTGGVGGVLVSNGTTGVQTSSVYARDAQTPTSTTDAPDDLWVIVPDRNAFGETCTTSPGLGGQAQVVTADTPAGAAGGIPLLPCTVNTFNAAGDLLLATHFVSSAPSPNLWSGALITATSFAGTNISGYVEKPIANYADTPYGFKKGDMVFRAHAYHFYVALDAQNIPTLFRQPAKVGSSSASGPLQDDTTQPPVTVPYIDDLQVQFGMDTTLSGDPSQYTFSPQLPAQPQLSTCTSTFWCASPALRSVRVSVVGRSSKVKRDTSTNKNTLYGPIAVDNHITVGTGGVGGTVGDGLPRTIFTERVELPSMAPANL